MANQTRTILIESILGGHSPMSHFAASDQFRASIGIDPALPADDTGSASRGIVASGLLRPAGYSTITATASTTISQPPMWLIQNPKNQYTYIYDAQSSLYSLDSNLANPTVIPDTGELSNGRGNGAEYYDNYLYLSKNTTVARYGPLNGTPTMNGDYWAGTLVKAILTDTSYPINGSPTALISYFKLDGNSNDSVFSHNGVDLNITYVSGILGSAASFSNYFMNAISYWKFDEASGNASDSIGSNTLVNNNATAYAAGKINNGADLELSSSQYFSITDAAQSGLDFSSQLSFSAWVKLEQLPSTAGSNFIILSKADGGASNKNSYILGIDTSNKLYMVLSDDGTQNVGHTLTITANAATFAGGDVAVFAHIAVSVDLPTNTITFYKNGVAIASTKVGTMGTSLFNNNVEFRVGSQLNAAVSVGFFDGIIDEVCAWNAAIASTTITALYNAGSALAYTTPSKITVSPSAGPSGSYTISFWMKHSGNFSGNGTDAATEAILGNQDSNAGGILVYGASNSECAVQYRDNAGNAISFASGNINIVPSTYNLLDGNWHHIVFTYDSSTLGVASYADGVLIGTAVLNSSLQFAGNSLVIGVAPGNTFWGGLKGTLDEVGIWLTALSASQVSTLYAAGVGITYPFTTLGSGNSGNSLKYPNHVLHRHSDGRLYISDVVGNQGTIHFIKTTKTTVEGDTDNGSTYGALTLGYGLYPTALETYGTDIAIALYEGTVSGSRGPNAKLAFWDTTSQSVNTISFEEFPDNIITSLKNINGVLYITSGIAGQSGFRVSRFIGGSSVEEVFYNELGTAPFAGAVDGDSNRLLFASSSSIPITTASVFSYGLQKAKLGQGLFNIASLDGALATALIIPQRPSNSLQNGLSFNTPLVGWDTGTPSGEVGCFSAQYSNSAVYWWSQMYRIGRPFKITRIRIPLANAVSASTILNAKFYLDEGDVTKELTTINFANFSGKKSILISPENLTGEHNFWLELKWSGADLCVVGLPITIEYEIIDD